MMLETFANLPSDISNVISTILKEYENTQWIERAQSLHERYMAREQDKEKGYILDFPDALAYLALRFPATYAQIYGALSQVKEAMPSFAPKSVLDLGSGPGTGIFAAKTIWSSLQSATCIDKEDYFLSIGKEILEKAAFPLPTYWQQKNLLQKGIENYENMYDLIIIGNILNELNTFEIEEFLNQAYTYCRGVMVIIEPGTPYGYAAVAKAAKNFLYQGTLLAPYIDNTFIEKEQYWLHFSQRFIRPPFQKRIRQHMRESILMASDYEEAKYTYVAIGKMSSKENVWGRCVGPVKKQKGFLQVPILTKNGIQLVKVMKRKKEEYTFAKNLVWGQIIKSPIGIPTQIGL